MSKILIALPILALLTVGAYMMIRNNVEASSNLTFDQWQFCFQSLPVKTCDQLTDSTELSKCYAAANVSSGLMWDGARNELNSCQSFYTYFKNAQSGDALNLNNFYNSCFSDASVITAAKQSNYFYSQIFAPKYLTCAGLSA